MARPLVSLVAFQVCWFACVGGAARGLPWLGPPAVAVYAAGYLRTIPSRAARTRQAWLLGAAGAVGYAADSVLCAFAMPLLLWMETRARLAR